MCPPCGPAWAKSIRSVRRSRVRRLGRLCGDRWFRFSANRRLLEKRVSSAYRNGFGNVTKPEFSMAVEKYVRPLVPSRREFVQAGIGVSAAGLAAMASLNKVLAADTQSAKSLIQPGETILFQGDSITDA